jgi:hypothetical protein
LRWTLTIVTRTTASPRLSLHPNSSRHSCARLQWAPDILGLILSKHPPRGRRCRTFLQRRSAEPQPGPSWPVVTGQTEVVPSFQAWQSPPICGFCSHEGSQAESGESITCRSGCGAIWLWQSTHSLPVPFFTNLPSTSSCPEPRTQVRIAKRTRPVAAVRRPLLTVLHCRLQIRTKLHPRHRPPTSSTLETNLCRAQMDPLLAAIIWEALVGNRAPLAL